MQKNRIDVRIDKNAIVDDGDGVVRFDKGLTITDESTHWSGREYDIKSMDISEFREKVFADHDYSIQSVVGKAFGLAKVGKRVVIEGIRFATEQSALALYAYNMLKAGFVDEVSIGTIGGEEDEKGRIKGAKLFELSLVGIGNNKNARVQEIAVNAIKTGEAEGLDTSELRQLLVEKNPDLPLNKEKDMDEKEKQRIEAEAKEATERAEKAEAQIKELQAKIEKLDEENDDESEESKELANAIAELTKSVETIKSETAEKLAEIDKNLFDKGAKAPEFVPAKEGAKDNKEFSAMPWQELTAKQVQSFYKAEKEGDSEARQTLHKINEFHKEQLKESDLVKKNVVTLGDFGNFVTNPELLTEIVGYRSDYSQVLSAFPYTNTNSLQMAYLTRSGDIDMQPVEMCDDGEDGNLKPISDYDATPTTKDLEELAAVTPVCNAATIFLAADLLGDVAAGYRNSYDRNLARGVVAALEQAAEANPDSSFGWTASGVDTPEERLNQIRAAVFSISQGDGVLVMNEATFGTIWGELVSLGAGGALTDTIIGGDTVRQLWGKRLVIVPNDLLPTVGTSDTKTFAYEGDTVTVNHAIFYVNPQANFRGRQNGSLRYDLSTDAAYEVDGSVRSAFQRNEVVLRGSHFRGSAILDPTRVGAIRAQNVVS